MTLNLNLCTMVIPFEVKIFKAFLINTPTKYKKINGSQKPQENMAQDLLQLTF